MPITRALLLCAGVTLEMPILMVLLSRLQPPGSNRIVTDCAAEHLTGCQLGSFAVGTGVTLHCAFFSAMEIHGGAATGVLSLRRKRGCCVCYEIVIGGYVCETWFEGLTALKQPNVTTMLRGHLVDQAALYGVLRRINNLGLELISVNRVREAAKR